MWIHGDDGNSLCMRALFGSLQFLFDDVLNVLIYGRQQIRARDRRFLDAMKAAAARIGHNDDSACITLDVVVVTVFQAAHAFFIDIHVAKHMRSKFALWIETAV